MGEIVHLDSEPHAAQDLSLVGDPQELIVLHQGINSNNLFYLQYLSGRMELCCLLIDKECVRNPDKLYVVSSNHQLPDSILEISKLTRSKNGYFTLILRLCRCLA